MRVFAVDVETTGLDARRHSILEVAILSFELGGDLGKHEVFHRYIIPEDMVWSQFCLKLHEKMIAKLVTGAIPVDKEATLYSDFNVPKQIPIGKLRNEIQAWLRNIDHSNKDESGRTVQNKMIGAGKNFATFDKLFLDFACTYETLFKHRTLDPTMAYIEPGDNVPPELKVCKERAMKMGLKFNTADVLHNALSDCWDVAKLLDFAYKNRTWKPDLSNL